MTTEEGAGGVWREWADDLETEGLPAVAGFWCCQLSGCSRLSFQVGSAAINYLPAQCPGLSCVHDLFVAVSQTKEHGNGRLQLKQPLPRHDLYMRPSLAVFL